MARPSGLNQIVAKQLLDALAVDGDFAHACQVAGVPLRTGYHWRKLGEDPSQPLFVAFRNAVNGAIGRAGATKFASDIAAIEASGPLPATTDAGATAIALAKTREAAA